MKCQDVQTVPALIQVLAHAHILHEIWVYWPVFRLNQCLIHLYHNA
jgi:hypothetical protein